LTTSAYQQIRAAILRMEFQPGQKLQETALAEWLGTSRTPVREALRQLQGEGLIETSASRGVVVAEVSIDDIENAYLVLEVLEALASLLAAERLADADASRLRAILDDMNDPASTMTVDRWAGLDSDFHDTIRSIAANPKLAQVANMVYPVIECVRSTYLREGSEPDRLATAISSHTELGEAILARDGPRAETLTRALFAKARLDNVRLLRHWVLPLRRSF